MNPAGKSLGGGIFFSSLISTLPILYLDIYKSFSSLGCFVSMIIPNEDVSSSALLSPMDICSAVVARIHSTGQAQAIVKLCVRKLSD